MVASRIASVVALVVAACSRPVPATLRSEVEDLPADSRADATKPSRVPADQVPALTRAFYDSLGVIHATFEARDAADTPLLASLQPCQIEPARAVEHPGFAKFFPRMQFFASSCADGSFAVVSIDEQRTVHLVALEPHERLPAPAWDTVTSGPIVLAGPDDARLFASAFGSLTYLDSVAPAQLTLREHSGTGSFAGTRYYEIGAPSFTVILASEDQRTYNVAGSGRL